MQAQRITREEVLAALRSQGVSDAAEVVAVVLETDGSLSVIKHASEPAQADASMLANVEAKHRAASVRTG